MVQFDKLLDDGQAQPGTAMATVIAVLHLHEALKNLVAHLGRHPRPIVTHPNVGLPPSQFQRDLNMTAVRRKFEGIGQQVQQNPLQLDRIDLSRGRCRCGHLVIDASVAGQRSKIRGDMAHQLGQIQLHITQLQLPRVQLGHVQQIVHLLQQHARLPLDQG